jgi:hypothetical protein
MLEANFSAFHRNKKGVNREVLGKSCVDFRFRNVEKWFEERRHYARVSPPSSNGNTASRSPPPGLKRGARYMDLWSKDELRIPTYDEFKFSETSSVEETANLLPKGWYSSKWQNGWAYGIRNVWFLLPPDIEEDDCDMESDDLPLNVYEGGRAALDSLPFVDYLQYNFYMTVYQEYFKMFRSSLN